MWQDNSNSYQPSSSQNSYYGSQPQQGTPLQFYSPGPAASDPNFYPGSRPSLDGNAGAPQGSIAQANGPGYGGSIPGPWWTAFGTGGFEGEPPLLEGTDFT
jgi:protein YIPF5/7